MEQGNPSAFVRRHTNPMYRRGKAPEGCSPGPEGTRSGLAGCTPWAVSSAESLPGMNGSPVGRTSRPAWSWLVRGDALVADSAMEGERILQPWRVGTGSGFIGDGGGKRCMEAVSWRSGDLRPGIGALSVKAKIRPADMRRPRPSSFLSLRSLPRSTS